MGKIKGLKTFYKGLLSKTVPKLQEVDIEIHQKNRRFISKIIVRAKGHVFCSKKTDSNITRSLRSATYAVMRQAEKAFSRQKTALKHLQNDLGSTNQTIN